MIPVAADVATFVVVVASRQTQEHGQNQRRDDDHGRLPMFHIKLLAFAHRPNDRRSPSLLGADGNFEFDFHSLALVRRTMHPDHLIAQRCILGSLEDQLHITLVTEFHCGAVGFHL